MNLTDVDFEEFLDSRRERAIVFFRKTEGAKRLRINSNHAENFLKNVLCEDHHACLEDFLDTLADEQGAESTFLYRQGYLDCVALLKDLQVLK